MHRIWIIWNLLVKVGYSLLVDMFTAFATLWVESTFGRLWDRDIILTFSNTDNQRNECEGNNRKIHFRIQSNLLQAGLLVPRFCGRKLNNTLIHSLKKYIFLASNTSNTIDFKTISWIEECVCEEFKDLCKKNICSLFPLSSLLFGR